MIKSISCFTAIAFRTWRRCLRNRVDHAVFSPPFPSLYAYTDSVSDIGNSEDLNREAKTHLGFFYRQLARIIKPGRVALSTSHRSRA
jgi:hypothetical protein